MEDKMAMKRRIFIAALLTMALSVCGCMPQQAALSGVSLGGTSIIIVVGVALETVRALEAQMLMRNYKGFLS